MIKKLLVEFSETRIDDNGHRVPVLPWDGEQLHGSRWIAAASENGYRENFVLAVISGPDRVIQRIVQSKGVTELFDDEEKEVSREDQIKVQSVRSVAEKLAVPIDARETDKVKVIVDAFGKRLKPRFDSSTFVLAEDAIRKESVTEPNNGIRN